MQNFSKMRTFTRGKGVSSPANVYEQERKGEAGGGSNKGQFYANVIIEGPLIKLVRHQFFFFLTLRILLIL